MTPRQARRERRDAQRKTKKAAIKSAKGAAPALREFLIREKVQHCNGAPENLGGFVSQAATQPLELPRQAAQDTAELDGFVSQTPSPALPVRPIRRDETNRANARLSTGPRTPQGKSASSRNSTKHGLASGQLIVPGEFPADFEALLEDLVAEHGPATPSEEMLVKEMAQSYWLAQRALRLQNECFTAQGIDEKRLALFLRYHTTHHRAFYKALNTLLGLKKEGALATRGLVSQPPTQGRELAQQAANDAAESDGFVPQNAQDQPANNSAKARREAA